MTSTGYDEELYADLADDYDSSLKGPSSYSPDQRQALEIYTGLAYGGNGYEWLNKALRNGDQGALDEHASAGGMTYRQVSDHLHAAMSQTRTSRDMVVFRGIRAGAIPPLQIGDEITDDAFISTSVDPGEAQDFSYTSDGTVLEVSVPKGTPALRGEPDEHELILKPGSRMRVVGREPNGHVKVVLV